MGTAKQQGAIWGARAVDWAEANEPAWTPLFNAVLDMARVRQGTRYLDVGCGAGGALSLAHARGAEVSGLDAAPALVEIARHRLPGVTIEVGEMEQLPFADQSFDVVSGINSFQFAGDLSSALAEAARVCRKGGIVAMLVWGPRERCVLLSRVMPAVFALLPPAAPPASPPPVLSESGVIEGPMAVAGLVPIETSEIQSSLDFSDLAQATRAILSAASRAIAHAGESQVHRKVEDALRPLVGMDGKVCLENVFRLVLASPNV